MLGQFFSPENPVELPLKTAGDPDPHDEHDDEQGEADHIGGDLAADAAEDRVRAA